MEPASFAVGLIGLAGLFGSCLEVLERAQSYRSFASDSKNLDVQFNATKIRLENWGRAVGFNDGTPYDEHHPALDEEKTRRTAVEIFNIIKDTCNVEDAQKPRSSSDRPGGTGAGDSRRRKFAWALGAKLKRTEQISLLKELVQALYDLVPPDGIKGYPPASAWSAEIRQVIDQLKAKTPRELHAWPRQVPDERYEESLQRRLQGTCGWILERPTFLAWAASEFPNDTNKVLWIHGPAGFGKTILCANMVEHMTKTLQTPVAHFFFSPDSDSRENLSVVLRSWLSQVASQHEGAFECLLRRYEDDANPIATPHTIVSLFEQVVRIVPECTFVVDSLDECTDLSPVTKFLTTLITATTATNTRVLVVSRPLLTIQEALKSNGRSAFSEHQIQSDDVRSDIEAYSRDIINMKLRNRSPDFRSALSEAMVERCEGQFLWLKLQGESLRRGMSKKQLENIVNDTPTDLDRVYDNNWKRIVQFKEADRHRTFALLRWTAFALRPLTICEITEAVLIDDTEELPRDDLPDDVDEDYVGSEVVGLCSPLLEVRSGPSASVLSQQTVHLPHFTVRQYLLRNLPIPDWLRQNDSLRISHEQLQHTLLAKACLQYIKYREVWQATPVESLPPLGTSFRTYASNSWHHHINLGLRSNVDIVRFAVEFITEGSPTRKEWALFTESDDTKEHGSLVKTSPPSALYYSVKLQLTEVTMSLIEGGNCDVNETHTLGNSVLSIACSDGTVDVAAMLLKKGANPSLADVNGMVPIHVAAKNGHVEVLRLLLKDDTRTPALTGNLWTSKYATQRGVGVDAVDVSLMTPLHYSALHGQTRCVEVLLQQGARLTADVANMTPLHYAVAIASEEMILCFLAAGVPIDSRVKRHAWRQEYRQGKLHYTRGKENDHGFWAEVDSHTGLTALHYAALIGSRQMTKFLLDHGADPNAVSEHGETSLHLALKREIYNGMPHFKDRWSDPVYRAEGILDFIDNPEDEVEYLALNATIETERLAVVDLLLYHSVSDVNVQDTHGASSLHHVLYEKNTAGKVIERLIQKGADVSARNHYGRTPLHLACNEGNRTAVATLLDYGADIAASDCDGLNTLHHAARNGDAETMQLLLSHADSVGSTGIAASRDKRQRNALHHLAEDGLKANYAALQCLLDGGVEVNDLDIAGMSPLSIYLSASFVLSKDAPLVAQLFLQRGSDTSFKARKGGLGLRHLHAHSWKVNMELLVVLAKCGVDLQAEDDDGRTVLHHCAIAGSLKNDVFVFLRDVVGLSENSQDVYGKTPKQYAAEMRTMDHHRLIFDRHRWSRTEQILLC
ncbi:hypothetical protein AK830_g10649 [Neonectria ditissima]|uniref:NACHT domain-containing protein n=1 Tax=Neonectria ditissima TaxID=78410 RepID=A0A0P7B5M7_9HYPO|nr:hypothetical protein AK830_g10649 [Neonectria ditissima]